MSRISGDQIRKKLDEAEGYLMLDLARARTRDPREPARTG